MMTTSNFGPETPPRLGAALLGTPMKLPRCRSALAAGPDTCLLEISAVKPDPNSILGSGFLMRIAGFKPVGTFHKIQDLAVFGGRVAYARTKARMDGLRDR